MTKFPNVTSASSEQLQTMIDMRHSIRDTIINLFARVIGTTAAPPFAAGMLLMAHRGVADVATMSGCIPQEIAAMFLVSLCTTEQEAVASVTDAFNKRRAVEMATGVSHGPDAGAVREQA